MAGAGPDERDPLTCESFPPDDSNDRCEPKLRALLSSQQELGLLTFEYDDAGRPISVGDQRSHVGYFRHRYGYDDEGRLLRIEHNCDQQPSTCVALEEFEYAEAGWLQTARTHSSTPGWYDQTTYDEAGRVLETLWAGPDSARGRSFTFRSDGQIDASETFEVDANGVRTSISTSSYEYGDDGLLDRIVWGPDPEDDVELHSHIVEDGRVRVESWGDYEITKAVVFDDVGRPAFESWNIQGLPEL